MSEISRRAVLAGAGLAACAGIAGCGKSSTPGASSATSSTPGATTPGAATTSAPSGPAVTVAKLADVPVGGGTLVTVDGKDLIVTQPKAGEVAVFRNACTHQGSKVAVSGDKLVCPLHGSTFALDGSVLKAPATVPLKGGAARIEGDSIVTDRI